MHYRGNRKKWLEKLRVAKNNLRGKKFGSFKMIFMK
jgi:hypothetical protein